MLFRSASLPNETAMAADVTTAADLQRAFEDGDRWLELVAGRLVRLSPPDEIHGNVVRNLSKALGKHFRKNPTLYPVFELGLVLSRDPDTVRCPAISCFSVGDGLAQSAQLVTDARPELIVEVASSNDRREAMSDRIRDYQHWGVPAIWVFDPVSQHAHVFHRDEAPRMLKETELLHGKYELAGLQIGRAHV